MASIFSDRINNAEQLAGAEAGNDNDKLPHPNLETFQFTFNMSPTINRCIEPAMSSASVDEGFGSCSNMNRYSTLFGISQETQAILPTGEPSRRDRSRPGKLLLSIYHAAD